MQGVFLAKNVYKFKEISLVQQVSLPAYPKDGHPSYSLIKNILSNFEKYVFVKHVLPKHKNLGRKTKNGQNTARKPVLGFSLIVNQGRDICFFCFSHTSVLHV